MATSLFKLKVNASTTTSTVASPAVEKFFYTTTDTGDATLVISCTSFYDDSGAAVTTNLTTMSDSNGYYLLTINAQIQQSALFTVDGTGSTVSISSAATIPTGTPITLAVNNFAPSSTSTTTVTT